MLQIWLDCMVGMLIYLHHIQKKTSSTLHSIILHVACMFSQKKTSDWSVILHYLVTKVKGNIPFCENCKIVDI